MTLEAAGLPGDPNPGPNPDPGAPPWEPNNPPQPAITDIRLGQIQDDPTLAGADEIKAMAQALRKFMDNAK